jgi:hypothetical protein
MKMLRYIVIGMLALFGVLTLFLSTSVIFNLFGIRAMEGNYVMFVVVANFISSILYLLSVYGLIMFQKWSTYLLGLSAIILIVAFIGLEYHVNAMIFRSILTVGFTGLAFVIIRNKYSNQNSN